MRRAGFLASFAFIVAAVGCSSETTVAPTEDSVAGAPAAGDAGDAGGGQRGGGGATANAGGTDVSGGAGSGGHSASGGDGGEEAGAGAGGDATGGASGGATGGSLQASGGTDPGGGGAAGLAGETAAGGSTGATGGTPDSGGAGGAGGTVVEGGSGGLATGGSTEDPGAGGSVETGGSGGSSTGGGAGDGGGPLGTGGMALVDECALGTDDCDDNATCEDTEASFDCTCNPGFIGDGRSCHCREPSPDNVLVNGGLDEADQLTGWTAAVPYGVGWEADDADGCPGSGSIKVWYGTDPPAMFFGNFSQCVRVTGGDTYYFGFKYKQEANTSLYCLIQSYTTVDCSGDSVESLTVQGAQVATPLDWTSSTPDQISMSAGVRSAKLFCQTNSANAGNFDQLYLNPAEASY